MIRLSPDQYPIVQNVIDDDVPFVAVSMLYQRREGDFWVDRLQNPGTVIARFPSDLFVWGDLSHPGVKDLLAGASGLEPLLQEVWPGCARLPSVEYAWVGHGFGAGPGALPEGFRLEPVGTHHLEMLLAYRPRYRTTSRIGDFRSFDDFFQNGYGYIVVEERTRRVVSACMAHSVSQERADHSLRTLSGYERRGLAYACSHATVREGVRRGLRPLWVTEAGNHGSRRIAERMGLRLRRQYTLFERES